MIAKESQQIQVTQYKVMESVYIPCVIDGKTFGLGTIFLNCQTIKISRVTSRKIKGILKCMEN